jgi:magnesium-protoporphyrin O-methyltransferase
VSECCRAAPCEEIFDSQTAEGDLEEYLERGLGDLEERMLAAIPAAAITGARRVLEIGGGIGAIQAELLLKGADSGEVIELVKAYEPYARRLATKLGLGGRTAFRVADLIADPGGAESADVVVMNRVVCCSEDGLQLTGVAAGLARRVLALSYPRSLAVLRWAEWLQQPFARLFRRRYRFYIHDSRALQRAATASGMHLLTSWHGLFWEYSVFERADRVGTDHAGTDPDGTC